MKLSKSNVIKSLCFIVGVIITLIIKQIWGTIFPEKPVILKEVADSIKIVHEYNIPKDSDSLSRSLSNKLKTIKMLNNYEDEIDRRIKSIKRRDSEIAIPNLIKPNIAAEYNQKGFTQDNAAAFFEMDCPDLNGSKYIDFHINFFNPKILNEIAYLKLYICKYRNDNSTDATLFIMDECYEVNIDNQNLIRLENNLNKGRYEISVGFVLNKDLNNKYPNFRAKKCILIKN
jgi:hypothetical protein